MQPCTRFRDKDKVLTLKDLTAMSPGKPASEHIIPVQCAVFGWKYVESGSMTREDSMTHNRREWGELHRGGGIWVFKNKLGFQDRGDIVGCTMQGECHFFRQKV